MKKIIISLLTVSVVLAGITSCQNRKKAAKAGELSGEIQLSGAFALYPMAVRWAEEFKKLHPDVRIDVSGGGAGKGMTDVLAGVVDLGMVSREIHPEELQKGALGFATVKDAVVPTINAANPDLKDLMSIGLKRDVAKRLWNSEFHTWGEVLGTGSSTPVHVFTRSDACGAAETWAKWFGEKQEDLNATAVFGDPGLADAVRKDPGGIGFNNIAFAYDQKTGKPFTGLAIMPLDVNDDGKIAPEEQFYDTSDKLIAAINDGRYPSPPARDLYLVSKGAPTKPEVVAFLKYILTDGQKYAGESGYIGLDTKKLEEELHKLK